MFPVGFGAMPLSVSGRPDEATAIATIHAALDAGVNLIDTADAYCLDELDTGHNERLVARAIAGRPDRDEIVVATKGGHVRGPSGEWLLDGRPEHLRSACEASLRALGVEAIDLYQYHRPDPAVPFAESVGAVAELAQEGKVVEVGLSNVTVEQIREAQGITRIASVQNRFGPGFTSSIDELRYCANEGIAVLAWAPLGGAGVARRLGEQYPALAEMGERHDVTAQRATLAWILAQSPTAIPIPGARRPETARDSAAAATTLLGAYHVENLDSLLVEGAGLGGTST